MISTTEKVCLTIITASLLGVVIGVAVYLATLNAWALVFFIPVSAAAVLFVRAWWRVVQL